MGPKGLYGLERVAIEVLRGSIPAPLELYLFEPHPYPGAGPVYDPRQPSYLRMNFANRHVDMWSRSCAGLPFPRPTLIEWLAARHPDLADPHGYAPRGVVGEYLHGGFLDIVGWLRQQARVLLHPELVKDVCRRQDRWTVWTRAQKLTVDEVLIATGHRSRTVDRDESGADARIVPSVYPVRQPRGLSEIPPGCTAAIRGFGLTSLDAALALTEGRGGRFAWRKNPASATYRSSGLEVRTMLPFSRTGRPMNPKPDARFFKPAAELDELWAAGREALDELARNPPADAVGGVYEAILATLSDAADRALRIEHRGSAGGNARSHLDRLCSSTVEKFSGEELRRAMTRSLEAAVGERPPGTEWALGAAWRGIYPGLVRLVAARRIRGAAWTAFAGLAREMERVAFGPPAENAARYLALVRAGIVDLSAVAGPQVHVDASGVRLACATLERSADVLVDAVLAPPGAAPRGSALMRRLLARGDLRTLPWNSGAEVTADGACIGGSGQVSRGLSMVGRPTEGCVLGNDTLSRTLDATPARWARALARRLRKPLLEPAR